MRKHKVHSQYFIILMLLLQLENVVHNIEVEQQIRKEFSYTKSKQVINNFCLHKNSYLQNYNLYAFCAIV